MKDRISSLDYLRGLMASLVMIYHYTVWLTSPLPASSLLGRFGVYGVSIFYILSGITLYSVYRKGLIVRDFAIKRILRIYPLLWFCISVTLLYTPWPHWKIILLNYSGIFGFTPYAGGIATGSWSIGNELFFYCFFPLLLFLLKRNKSLFGVFIIISFLASGFYMFYLTPHEGELKMIWGEFYIKPLNQFYLFTGGVTLAYLLDSKEKIYGWKLYVGLMLCMLLFAFFPTKTSTLELLQGFNRLFLSVTCFGVCALFYLSEFNFPSYIHRPLHFLGEKSYSIYLLHPIVYQFYSQGNLHTYLKFPLAIATTIIVSHFMNILLEKPTMDYSKKIITKKAIPHLINVP